VTPQTKPKIGTAALLLLAIGGLATTTAAFPTNYVESLSGSSIIVNMITIPGGDAYQGTPDRELFSAGLTF
jgi:hypothetical protein